MDDLRLVRSRQQPSTQLVKSSPAYAEWITTELTRIAVLLGEQVSAERLSLTLNELTDIEPEVLSKAFAHVRRNSRFFPKPAEILEIVKRIDPYPPGFFDDFKESRYV